MKCFRCGAELEREDYADWQYGDWKHSRANALYWCEECGFTAHWRLRQPIEVLHDPAKDRTA